MDVNKNDEWLELKTLVLIGLFSDDLLMSRLVLKGGNALAIGYGMNSRASLDLDFSIVGEFTEEELRRVFEVAQYRLNQAFHDRGLQVVDLKLIEKPPEVDSDLADFWGGYEISFKLVHSTVLDTHQSNLENLRRNALVIGPGNRRTMKIDISKHEYCAHKKTIDLRGLQVSVYRVELVLLEKLRAICQQMPEYRSTVRSQERSGRARDFFDIEMIRNQFGVVATRDLAMMGRLVFARKRVDWALLTKIREYREIHEQNFGALRDTVYPGIKLKKFDEYFDRVVGIASELYVLGDE